MFIGGAFVSTFEGRHVTLVNPSTEESFATVLVASDVDADAAVQAARAALPTWSRLPFP